jgi:type I restriction enzyme, S subunit
MSEWEMTTVGEIAEIFDGPHATPAKTEAGPWFLSISSLKQGQLDLSESAHLSDEDFRKWTRRVTPGEGDVLFSYETRLGEAALMPAGIQACLGRRMGLLRPKENRTDSRFLLYAYLSPEFQHVIRERSIHGATVDRIPLVELPSWPIRLPEPWEQRAIAELLGALDDKIAVNNRISAIAHGLAQAHSARAHDSAELAKLSYIAEITMGSSPPGESYNEGGVGMPFYQGTRDFGDRFPGRRVWCTAPVRTASEGACLVSVRAPVGRVNIARELCCIGRGVAAVRSKQNTPSVLFHELVASSDVWLPFESEGTVFGAINKQQLVTIKIPALGAESAQLLEGVLQPLDRRVASAYDENQALSTLRDTLLPKLMSGEIRVRDAEKVVEDVT